MRHHIGTTCALLLSLIVGCSQRDLPRVADACDLLTAEEVSQAIGAVAQPGRLVAAIGEDEARLCSFAVAGDLGTVTVYLGEGPVSPTQATDSAVASSASEGIFVAVSAQNYDPDFAAVASALAQRAIQRAARDPG